MASESDIRAGGAYVDLYTKDTKLNKGLASGKKSVSDFGKTLVVLGAKIAAATAVIVAPMLASLRLFSNVGDEVAKAAKRIGAGAEQFSILSYGAKLAGSGLSVIETGYKFLQRSIVEAATAGGKAKDSFDALGLSVEQLESMTPDQQFMVVAKAMNKVQNVATRTYLAMDLFGRSGTSIIPYLDDLAVNFDSVAKQAKFLGVVFSEEAAKKAEELNDQFERVSESVKGLRMAFGSILAQSAINVSNTLMKVFAGLRSIVEAHPAVVIAVTKIAFAFSAIGASIGALGLVIMLSTGIVGVLTLLSTAILVVAETLGITQTGVFDLFNSFTIYGNTAHQWMQKFALYTLAVWDAIVLVVRTALAGMVDAMMWAVEKVLVAGRAVHAVSQDTLNKFRAGRENVKKGMGGETDEQRAKLTSRFTAINDLNEESALANKGKSSLSEVMAGIGKKIKDYMGTDIEALFAKQKVNTPTIPTIPTMKTPMVEEKTGVIGAFGQNFRESMGMPQTEASKQTDLLRKISTTLSSIEDNTDSMEPTYA
jgi:hypothetical protein